MDRFNNYSPNILVIGDLMIDHYLFGKCERISPEAPVGVVDVEKELLILGGAGNVINNLLSFKASVGVASVIGDDETGQLLGQMLEQKGVKKEALIVQHGRKTSKKSRIVALHQQMLRVDKESKDDIEKSSEDEMLEKIRKTISDYDLIILSDYGKGVLTKNLTEKIILTAKENNKRILIDPKGEDYSKYKGATLITPNKKETQIATKIKIDSYEKLKEAGFKLKNDLCLDYAVVTLSEDGIAIFGDDIIKIDAVAKEVYDVTGAGDTVLASLGFAMACSLDIKEASRFANSAAAVVVGKLGSATATIEEVLKYEHSLSKGRAEDKIKTIDELKKNIELLRDKKIVFTNGCFDILHKGHAKYLEEAKSYGDILVVGVNSDLSVKKLKGEQRPINVQDDRAYILASLESVDFVVIFEEETPLSLIEAIEPDILVKGGDYEGKEVVGCNIAKEVRLVKFVEGKSTTNIINAIKL